jgi:hypothetical protein
MLVESGEEESGSSAEDPEESDEDEDVESLSESDVSELLLLELTVLLTAFSDTAAVLGFSSSSSFSFKRRERLVCLTNFLFPLHS